MYKSVSELNFQGDNIIQSITMFDMTGRRKVISFYAANIKGFNSTETGKMFMGYVKQYARSICVIILITGMSAPCMAEPAPVFGGVSDILPFSYEENGIAKGFFSDLFLEAAHRAGFKVSLRLFPVKRLWEYLESGEIDGAVTLVHTKAREEYLIFSKSPIFRSYTCVFVTLVQNRFSSEVVH